MSAVKNVKNFLIKNYYLKNLSKNLNWSFSNKFFIKNLRSKNNRFTLWKKKKRNIYIKKNIKKRKKLIDVFSNIRSKYFNQIQNLFSDNFFKDYKTLTFIDYLERGLKKRLRYSFFLDKLYSSKKSKLLAKSINFFLTKKANFFQIYFLNRIRSFWKRHRFQKIKLLPIILNIVNNLNLIFKLIEFFNLKKIDYIFIKKIENFIDFFFEKSIKLQKNRKKILEKKINKRDKRLIKAKLIFRFFKPKRIVRTFGIISKKKKN